MSKKRKAIDVQFDEARKKVAEEAKEIDMRKYDEQFDVTYRDMQKTHEQDIKHGYLQLYRVNVPVEDPVNKNIPGVGNGLNFRSTFVGKFTDDRTGKQVLHFNCGRERNTVKIPYHGNEDQNITATYKCKDGEMKEFKLGWKTNQVYSHTTHDCIFTTIVQRDVRLIPLTRRMLNTISEMSRKEIEDTGLRRWVPGEESSLVSRRWTFGSFNTFGTRAHFWSGSDASHVVTTPKTDKHLDAQVGDFYFHEKEYSLGSLE